MNVNDIAGLYFKNASYASLAASAGAGSQSTAEAAGALGGAIGGESTDASAFEQALRRAAAAESGAGAQPGGAVPSARATDQRPVGAAANSASSDAAHAGRRTQKVDRKSELYEQCRALESFVVKAMLDSMRKTVEKSEFTDGGFAGDMYEDMLYDQYSDMLTKTGGFGLADQVYLELTNQRITA